MRRSILGILAFMLLPMSAVGQTPVGQDPRLVEGDVACPRVALVFTTDHGHPLSAALLQTLVGKNVPATVLPADPDGRHPPQDPWRSEDVYNAVFHNAYPGAILKISLDDRDAERATVLALPRLVDDLRARGLEFVTTGELGEPCDASRTFTPETITLSGLDVHGLHCKMAPSQGAELLRILFNGDVVTTRGPAFDGWLPVACVGQDGWVKASALP